MNQDPEAGRGYLLSNKLYNTLKLLALVIFPAVGTFYFGLAQIWGLPAAEQVIATIVVIDTFLGVLIKIGDATYNASEARFDGSVAAYPNADRSGGHVELNLQDAGNPERFLQNKDEIILKVGPES